MKFIAGLAAIVLGLSACTKRTDCDKEKLFLVSRDFIDPIRYYNGRAPYSPARVDSPNQSQDFLVYNECGLIDIGLNPRNDIPLTDGTRLDLRR